MSVPWKNIDIELLAILALALGLRTAWLGKSPPGPFPDEASTVVDARCLRTTGADRHGRFLPMYLRAFGDYREAAFAYLTIPGLTIGSNDLLAARMTSALVGVAAVFLAFACGRAWFDGTVGLWSAFFLAVDPQHVFWSRIGMEIALVPLAGAATLLALASLRTGFGCRLICIAVGLGATMHAGLMGKPLALMLAFAGIIELISIRRFPGADIWLLCSLTILFVVATPAAMAIYDGAALQRFEHIRAKPDSLSQFLIGFIHRYFSYWSPTYLFSETRGLPCFPLAVKMSAIAFVAVWLGVAFLVWRRPPGWLTILFLFALAPAPAALTEDLAPSRLLIAAPVMHLLVGFAAAETLRVVSHRAFFATLMLIAWAPSGIALALDVSSNSAPTIDAIAYGPTRRMVKLVIDESARGQPVLIDVSVRFSTIYAIYYLEPPMADYQGRLTGADDLASRLQFGNVLLAYPPTLVNPLPDGALVLTHRNAVPGAETLFVDGELAIVRWSN